MLRERQNMSDRHHEARIALANGDTPQNCPECVCGAIDAIDDFHRNQRQWGGAWNMGWMVDRAYFSVNAVNKAEVIQWQDYHLHKEP